MNRRGFLKSAGLGASGMALQSVFSSCTYSKAKPNFIVIFVDDMGYSDISPFAATQNRTPVLDKMAAEGMRLTSFYAAPVCTPSRASLMTGCYPKRVGLEGSPSTAMGVLFPGDPNGLHPDEITVAELLKSRGYATACIGKWHLGDQPEFLPTRHGFDYYFGLPYSNDMIASHKRWEFPPLPLVRNEKILREVTLEEQASLTGMYTDEAVKFITDNKDSPFFLYLPHSMVHLPLHAGPKFKSKSKNGILGDAIEEIDWSTGEILDSLHKLGIAENTMVIFTSDNGPAAGTALPLRGKKGSTWEGGMRVPCIAWWPGEIPAGSARNEITSTMDVLPTLAGLAGAEIPSDRIIDGHDIFPLLHGRSVEQPPNEAFYYYSAGNLRAVRSGSWKLHISEEKMSLYNLDSDISERNDVAENNRKIVQQLMVHVENARKDLGDGSRYPGQNCRPNGKVENPEFMINFNDIVKEKKYLQDVYDR